MKSKSILLVLTVFLVFLTTTAGAQELMIYPAKGQSNDQMEKDKYECYTWAKGQTGFDPMKVPTASSPPPSQEKKSVGGAAVVGGALGAVGGAIIGGGHRRQCRNRGGYRCSFRRCHRRHPQFEPEQEGRTEAKAVGAGAGQSVCPETPFLQSCLFGLSRGQGLHSQVNNALFDRRLR